MEPVVDKRLAIAESEAVLIGAIVDETKEALRTLKEDIEVLINGYNLDIARLTSLLADTVAAAEYYMKIVMRDDPSYHDISDGIIHEQSIDRVKDILGV